MTKMINIPGRLHSVEKGNIVAGASEIYDDTQAKKQNVINSDLISASSSMQAAIEAILLLIPSAASALNQLADKAFVNSSVSTDTATFRGTYNLVSDLHLTVAATHAQIATALGTAISTADNNDYAFVQVPTADATPTEIKVTERYKFNGTSWAYEYDLNTSGFTAAQWAAINSTITLALVQKLTDLPTNSELANALAAKYEKPSGGIPQSDLAGDIPASKLAQAVRTILSTCLLTSDQSLTDANKIQVKQNLGLDDGAFLGGGIGVSNTVAAEGHTIATTAAQTAALTGYILTKNIPVSILFTNAIQVVNATLNINGQGAKPIYYLGTVLQPYVVRPNTIITFVYDGTNYNIVDIEGLEQTVEETDLWVDMGLPSGNLWAKANIDVEKESGFQEVNDEVSPFTYESSYFSWGNVDGHNPISDTAFDYDWGQEESGPYFSTLGSTLNGNIAPSFDAARVNEGAPWRIPSSNDIEELFNNIDYVGVNGLTTDTNIDGEDLSLPTTTKKIIRMNGIVGLRIKSKINGNMLFIPYCGYGGYGFQRINMEMDAYLWTVNYVSNTRARAVVLSNNYYSGNMYRTYGFNIRPVL